MSNEPVRFHMHDVEPTNIGSLEFEIGGLGGPMNEQASQPFAYNKRPTHQAPFTIASRVPFAMMLRTFYLRSRIVCWNVVSGELVRVDRADRDRDALIKRRANFRYRPYAILLESVICVLIIANVVGVCSGGTHRSTAFLNTFHDIASWTTAVLIVEYGLRVWTSVEDPRFANPVHGRLAFALSASARIDMLVALPYILHLFTPDCTACRLSGYFGSSCDSCWSWELVRALRITCFLRFERNFASFGRASRRLLQP